VGVTATRVYKLGGPALEDPGLLAPLAGELRAAEGRALVVHGGGRHVDRLLRAFSIESRFVDGRRETSPAAMEVVEMVLSGVVNKALAAGLTAAGLPAVGISGRDAGLLGASLQAELGRVGNPSRVDTAVLRALWEAGLLPVVSPVSSGPAGESVNVNADEAALALAVAVGANALVYLTDADGVLVEGAPVDALAPPDARRLMEAGTITGGMSLKVRVALAAAGAGIPEVVVAGKGRLQGGFAGTRIVSVAVESARA
jgi:acetylglutamate kinase